MAENPLLPKYTAQLPNAGEQKNLATATGDDIDPPPLYCPDKKAADEEATNNNGVNYRLASARRRRCLKILIAGSVVAVLLLVAILLLYFLVLNPSKSSEAVNGTDQQPKQEAMRAAFCNEQNMLVASTPTMKSIGYLGAGYDKIFANPLPKTNAQDLGYRQSIFDMSSYCGQLTADKQYRIPENITLRMQSSCSTHFNVEVIETVQNLYKTYSSLYSTGGDLAGMWSANETSDSGWVAKIIGKALGSTVGGVLGKLPIPGVAGVVTKLAAPIATALGNLLGNIGSTSWSNSTGVYGLSFTANKDFQEAVDEIKTKSKRIIENSASCTVYNAFINSFVHPRMTENFRRAVSQLPSDNFTEIDLSDEHYARFFKAFGTHVVTGLTMGAAFSERYFADEELWVKIKSTSTDWKSILLNNTRKSVCERGAKNYGSTAKFKCSNDSKDQTSDLSWLENQSVADRFYKMLNQRTSYSIGEVPPPNLEVEEWTRRTFSNPMPVFLKLELIIDLLIPDYFPDDPFIDQKRAGLLKALAGYCPVILKPSGQIATCEPVTEVVRKKTLEDKLECQIWTNSLAIASAVSSRLKLPANQFWLLKSTYNHKIYVIFKERVTRTGGSDPCLLLTKGVMRLATFHREVEMNCVTRSLQAISEIQAETSASTHLHSVAHLWVGMKRSGDGGFFWEDDNTPFAYGHRMYDEKAKEYVMIQYKKWWFSQSPRWHYFPHSSTSTKARPLCEVREDIGAYDTRTKSSK